MARNHHAMLSLVHAVPTSKTAEDKQGNQHPDRTARDREYVEDQRVGRRVVNGGPYHAEGKVDDERQKRHHVDRDQVYEKRIQCCPLEVRVFVRCGVPLVW